MLQVYDISIDEMREATEEDLALLQRVNRAYGKIRILIGEYRVETEGWEADDKLVSFISEIDQVHQELVARLEAPDESD